MPPRSRSRGPMLTAARHWAYGYVREGTLREDCVVNGDVSDSWVYGLRWREWPGQPEPLSPGSTDASVPG